MHILLLPSPKRDFKNRAAQSQEEVRQMARYTLIVGTRNWSSWSLRPFVALKAAGAAFETIDIRLRQTEAPTTREQILKHSPSGKVPILKIEENGKTLAVWDSLAICETIAERHPEAGLWPDDAAARAIARSYACEMHTGFPDVRSQLSMEFARKMPLPELREDTKIQVARIIDAWSEALSTYQGDFLFGRLSVADCMYAPVVSRFETYGIEVPAPVRAYMDRVLALPAMQEWKIAAEKEIAAGLGTLPDPR
jgi:glutathione S-transferase